MVYRFHQILKGVHAGKKTRFDDTVQRPHFADGETEARRGKTSCRKSNDRGSKEKVFQFQFWPDFHGPGRVRSLLASQQALKDSPGPSPEAVAGGPDSSMKETRAKRSDGGPWPRKFPHPGLTLRNSVGWVTPRRVPSPGRPQEADAARRATAKNTAYSLTWLRGESRHAPKESVQRQPKADRGGNEENNRKWRKAHVLPRGAGAGRLRGAATALRLRSHRLPRSRVIGVGGAWAGGGARARVTQAQCASGGAGRPLRGFGSGSVRRRDRGPTIWTDGTGSPERPSCKEVGALTWRRGAAAPRLGFWARPGRRRLPRGLPASRRLVPRRWLPGPGRACASRRPLGRCGLALPEPRALAPSRLRLRSRPPRRASALSCPAVASPFLPPRPHFAPSRPFPLVSEPQSRGTPSAPLPPPPASLVPTQASRSAPGEYPEGAVFQLETPGRQSTPSPSPSRFSLFPRSCLSAADPDSGWKGLTSCSGSSTESVGVE